MLTLQNPQAKTRICGDGDHCIYRTGEPSKHPLASLQNRCNFVHPGEPYHDDVKDSWEIYREVAAAPRVDDMYRVVDRLLD